tara:strand:- start:183 stop:611 length:429 start_codon:yes stop_codon:yes gene_type:complete
MSNVELEDPILESFVVEDDWLKIAEVLILGEKRDRYCDMLIVRERLQSLRKKYFSQRDIIIGKLYELEKEMDKKGEKMDGMEKLAVALSFGTTYKYLKKINKNTYHYKLRTRNSYVSKMADIEKNFLPRIDKMLFSISRNLP